MTQYVGKFIDISRWIRLPYMATGGTRNKVILVEPGSGKRFFYKTSIRKGEKYYKFEFWSEVIVSKIGQKLGLNVLDYNVAVLDNEMGCLSEQMFDPLKDNFIEGIRIIKITKPNFKERTHEYDFQLIEQSLHESDILDEVIRDFLKTIVFDCIIGNSDRHQENWAILVPRNPFSFKASDWIKNRFYLNLLVKLNRRIRLDKIRDELVLLYNKFEPQPGTTYSPIYDNGCSLGRELTDDRLEQLLNDTERFDRYIQKGLSNIRYNNKQLNHYDLIHKIHESGKYDIDKIIKEIITQFDDEEISNIILDIDNEIPSNLNVWSIPNDRKKFIVKLIQRRVELLKGLINDRS